MLTCYIFDFIIFLQMVINILFGPQGYIAITELGLIGNAIWFGFVFDIMGRKNVFMMRLMICSISTILVPFITFFPMITNALIMGSVSLTIPFIADLVKYEKRGLAYAYLGVLFIIAMTIVYFMIEFGIHKYTDTKWIFVVSGFIGISFDIMMCWNFSDLYNNSLRQ
jgi:MFS family permease